MNKIMQIRSGLFSNMNIVTRSCEMIMYFRIRSEREIRNSKIILYPTFKETICQLFVSKDTTILG